MKFFFDIKFVLACACLFCFVACGKALPFYPLGTDSSVDSGPDSDSDSDTDTDTGTQQPTFECPLTDIRGISGTAEDDIWAVGFGGNIMHFDGSQWTFEQLSSPFESVFAFADGKAFAVGGEDIYKNLDGNWDWFSSFPGVVFFDVWTSADSFVMAAGKNLVDGSGLILAWDGFSWNQTYLLAGHPLTSLVGYSQLQAYAVSQNGNVSIYDGAWFSGYQIGGASGDTCLGEIYPRNASELWITGYSAANEPLVYKANLATPTNISFVEVSLDGAFEPTGLWVSESSSVWISGTYTYTTTEPDSAVVVQMDPDDTADKTTHEIANVSGFNTIWGTSDDNVYAGGWGTSGGVLVHYDGAEWKFVCN